jgi:hypothetical protein
MPSKEQVKKQTDKGLADEQQRIDTLLDKDLILTILKELKKTVVSNEDMMLALINKVCIRLVKNSNPTSSNLFVSDESGAGKDWITKQVCKVLVPKTNYHHMSDISEKLLNYWEKPSKNDDSFDGHVLHFEDPIEERTKSQAFKVRTSGGNEIRIVHKGKVKYVRIRGKPVTIVTSLKSTIDEEGMRRWDSLRVDITEAGTKLMKILYADREAGIIDTSYDEKLLKALHSLRRVKVAIPYAPAIAELLPNHLIIRTQLDKIFDYIKSSAALHQYQREKTKDGTIIANMFDYDYACFCFVLLGDVHGLSLNKKEENIIEVLAHAESGGLTCGEIASRTSIGKSSLYPDKSKGSIGYMENLKEKEIVKEYESYDTDLGRQVSRWSLSENIKMVFELPTSPLLIDRITASKNERYSDLFRKVISAYQREKKGTEHTLFHFFRSIHKINEIRKSEGLTVLSYSQKSGMSRELLDMLREKNGQKSLSDSWGKRVE